MDPATGAIIPPNMVANQNTADNIDILDESLDGKNTFHATKRQPGNGDKKMYNLTC